MNRVPLNQSKKVVALLAIAASCPWASLPATAQQNAGSYYQPQIVSREAARRQEQARQAIIKLQEGREAYASRSYVEALELYRSAWDLLPKAPATAQQQQVIIDHIGDASIAVAMEYAKVGRYDDAEQLLLEVLERQPNNKRVKLELERLNDPIRNNPALTPEHVKNVEEVNRLLVLGESNYQLAKYDEANKTFARVLEIDPYNKAARRGQQRVHQARSEYYGVAHDSFRAGALAAVDAAWEVRLTAEDDETVFGAVNQGSVLSEAQIRNNDSLDTLRIAQVTLEETPLEEALDYLRAEARKQGLSNLNFVYEPPVPQAAVVEEITEDDVDSLDGDEEDIEAGPVALVAPVVDPTIRRINLSNVDGRYLLGVICDQANCSYRVDDYAIIITQKGANQTMDTERWTVAAGFFGEGSEEEDEFDDDEFGSTASKAKPGIDAIKGLEAKGVEFSGKARASYSRVTGTLTVHNTAENLALVREAILDYESTNPNKMYKVQAKFVEITQTNEEELSFDWVINPFSVSNSGDMYLGGVNATSSAPLRNTSDFVTSGGSAFANNFNGNGSFPVSSTSTNSNVPGLVTGGLRSGTGAASGSVLDDLLSVGSTHDAAGAAVAPGIMSLSGIYDSGSFQMIMRGLSQKKGVDVMSAPTLVARSEDLQWTPAPLDQATDLSEDEGAAKIEVIRRFYYPGAYSEPQLQDGNTGSGDGTSFPIATPGTPEDWRVEDIGISFRFKVAPESDPSVIKFERFEIRVVDFDGFINYGSPITSAVANDAEIQDVLITENRLDMPIFSRRYINSNPTVADGHTIALGGLIEDNIQKVEDKVPILGDIPLIGTLFRSNVESHIRKNLVIFVTAETITPSGAPIRDRSSAAAGNSPSLFPTDDGLE